MKYRITKPHAPDTPDHLEVKKGDRLTFERRPTNWDGWLFCTMPDSRTGWVPEAYVEIDGAAGVMRRDYNAFELTVNPGDTIEVELEEAGWGWGRVPDGRTGWVPLEILEPIP